MFVKGVLQRHLCSKACFKSVVLTAMCKGVVRLLFMLKAFCLVVVLKGRFVQAFCLCVICVGLRLCWIQLLAPVFLGSEHPAFETCQTILICHFQCPFKKLVKFRTIEAKLFSYWPIVTENSMNWPIAQIYWPIETEHYIYWAIAIKLVRLP